MTRTGTNKITIASHSLGAALGLLDAVMFKQRMPGTDIKFVGYGMPRVCFLSLASKYLILTNRRWVTPRSPTLWTRTFRISLGWSTSRTRFPSFLVGSSVSAIRVERFTLERPGGSFLAMVSLMHRRMFSQLTASLYSGQESEEDGCTIDDTRFIFQAEANDHRGPYNGVSIGSSSC